MKDEKAEMLQEVNEHITRAAALLRALGPSYDRVGWLLEDALMFLRPEELVDHADFDDFEMPVPPPQKIEAAS